jgi:DNA-binding IclR family transcriptional regulator
VTRLNDILVIRKVHAVLEALGDLGQAGPSEIALRIGSNKSTAFRLVNSMERVGLLDRNAGGGYSLGLWLMELGSLVESRLDLRRIADRELRLLAQDLGLTVFLFVRHTDQGTCIDRIAGEEVDVLATRLGGTLPLHCGGGPRVLLASLRLEELDSYLAHAPFPQLTPHTLTSKDEILADVELTRERGYALSMEDVTIGVAALGVPVLDVSNEVVAAISVSGLRHHFEDEQSGLLLELLRTCAARVSAALGARQGSS